MSIRPAGQHGAIVRKTARTRDFLATLPPVRSPDREDEALRAIRLGGNGQDVDDALESLAAAGLERGRDYVVTMSGEGVIDPMPDWLLDDTPDDETLKLQAGFHPALWSRFDAETQAHWRENLRGQALRYRAA